MFVTHSSSEGLLRMGLTLVISRHRDRRIRTSTTSINLTRETFVLANAWLNPTTAVQSAAVATSMDLGGWGGEAGYYQQQVGFT